MSHVHTRELRRWVPYRTRVLARRVDGTKYEVRGSRMTEEVNPWVNHRYNLLRYDAARCHAAAPRHRAT